MSGRKRLVEEAYHLTHVSASSREAQAVEVLQNLDRYVASDSRAVPKRCRTDFTSVILVGDRAHDFAEFAQRTGRVIALCRDPDDGAQAGRLFQRSFDPGGIFLEQCSQFCQRRRSQPAIFAYMWGHPVPKCVKRRVARRLMSGQTYRAGVAHEPIFPRKLGCDALNQRSGTTNGAPGENPVFGHSDCARRFTVPSSN